MTKTVYLLRHAQATNPGSGTQDKERPLTIQGISQIRELGRKLNRTGFRPDFVYCSTALRTRQTAENLLEEINYPSAVHYEEALYEASVQTLFDFILKAPDDRQHLLIIGHNPAISYLVEYLTKKPILGLAPGEMAVVSFPVNSWEELSEGAGTLVSQ